MDLDGGRNSSTQCDSETKRLAQQAIDQLTKCCEEMIQGSEFGKTTLEISWGAGQINTFEVGNTKSTRANRNDRKRR